MTVLQVCAYAAQYGGNFLASLRALDNELMEQGIQTIYLFPEQAKEKAWCRQLCLYRKVYFASSNRFSYKTFLQINNAMKDADIVHSHFELYDCLCVIARKKNQKLFWHLHDSFDENTDLLHKVIEQIQYGLMGSKVRLISPSRYYAECTVKMGFSSKNINIVENGIDCGRLVSGESKEEKKYDFLAFGGFYKIKGLDILLDAARILAGEGYVFSLGIVGYPETWKFIDQKYPDLGNYIIRENPDENVSRFYNAAGVFISASRRETFSYALAEALYLGLPVISSDIEGTRWANEYPNTVTYESEKAAELAARMEQALKGRMWVSKKSCETTSTRIKNKHGIEVWTNQIKGLYLSE